MRQLSRLALLGVAVSALSGCYECDWPGAGSVTYVSRESGHYDVRVVDPDGVCDQGVSTARGDELSPSFSLASGVIVYAVNRDGHPNLGVRDLESQVETVLDLGGLLVANPEVSPDGRAVVFEGSLPGALPDIYVVPLWGGTPVPLAANAALDVGPAWAHDGESVFFGSTRGGSYQIWQVGTDGSGIAQVTTDATSALTCGTGACSVLGKARPSPDGKSLALVRATPDQFFRVVVRSLETGAERVLSDDPDTEPAWSPDGRALAVATGVFGYPQVALRDAATGVLLRRLTFTDAIAGAPSFAR